jgi:hypothetical protein
MGLRLWDIGIVVPRRETENIVLRIGNVIDRMTPLRGIPTFDERAPRRLGPPHHVRLIGGFKDGHDALLCTGCFSAVRFGVRVHSQDFQRAVVAFQLTEYTAPLRHTGNLHPQRFIKLGEIGSVRRAQQDRRR